MFGGFTGLCSPNWCVTGTYDYYFTMKPNTWCLGQELHLHCLVSKTSFSAIGIPRHGEELRSCAPTLSRLMAFKASPARLSG